MKTKIITFILIIASYLSNAQNPEWINYYCGKENNVIVEESNFMWVGTSGGLVKINKLTNSSIFYNITNSGLPGNHVYSIAIDSLGNKWIGTGNGLAKFDGTTWTVYNDSNSGLPGNEITSIAIDGSGNKWIGAGEDGLTKFDGTSWTDYNQMFGLRNYGITSIAIDNSGTIWIGLLEEGGLVKFDGTNWTRYDSYNSGLPGSYVSSIAIDSIGNKWIGTSYGMAKFDGINWTAYYPINYGMSSNTIRSLAIDKIGNKWIGIGDYLAKFDGINWTIYHTPYYMDDIGQINSIAIDSIGNKWIGTKDGLAIFNDSTWNILITSNSGLPSDYVRSMAIDGCGNKWIGTSNGLVKFDGTNWSVYNSSNNYSLQSQTTSIAMDGIGNKWIGTHDGLFKYDGTNWTNYNTSNSGLSHNYVTSIAIDGNGNKWIGTNYGLTKFDGTAWIAYNISNSGLPNYYVRSIAIDDNGNIWIGTYYGGLAKYDGINWTVYNTSNSGLSSNFVNSITIDGFDNIWVGTSGGGLAKFNGTNWTVFNTMNSGLPNNEVNSIAIDGIGNKWIGTSNGLVKYDGTNWTVYNTLNSKLPNNEVTSIAIDGNGNKWIGTYYYGGLAIFKEGGIFNIEDNPTKYANIKLYLEGFYNPVNQNMNAAMNDTGYQYADNIADKVFLMLADPYYPFTITDTFNVSLQTNGMLIFDLPCRISGSHYLKIKHRNHIETWSRNAISFNSDSIYYDFSISADKVVGDNQKQLSSGIFALLVGDVNQDGVVDLSDLVDLDNDLINGTVAYTVNDLTGDGVVDLSDLVKIDENLTNGSVAVEPSETYACVNTISTDLSTTITVKGNISCDGSAIISERGFCYGTSSNPTISNNKLICGMGKGNISSVLNGLSPNTTYYVRAYATNSVGTAYGNELSFTSAFLPTVTTDSITFITAISATSGGKISFDGGAPVTARGICWSTSPNPTIADYKTINGNGTGNFTIDITALKQNKKYYVRAYAVNYAGIAYGNQISFTTLPYIYPVFDVDSNGYDTVHIGTQVWMKQNLNTSRYNDGTTIPNISDNALWSSLSSGARAYYNNDSLSCSYIYGAFYNWYTVNTGKLCPTGWHVPTDAEWTSLTTHLGGDSIAGGKLRATTLWNNPNTETTNESGFTALPASFRYDNGVFDNFFSINSGAYWWSSSEYLGNTVQNTISRYLVSGSNYLSKYTMNSKNKGYSVRCLMGDLARVSTDTVSGITLNSAIITGKIISDGGLSVTARGVCWSKTPYPTIALITKTNNGSGVGNFASIINDLSSGTTYYVRAYATNSDGTVYGNQISFITLPHPLYDKDGNGYDTVHIGTQVWMKQNLKTIHYLNGILIPNVTDNTAWSGLSSGARCYYNNDPATYADTYGALYNWYAVNTGNLCPFGWHVPTDNEWTALVNYLGGTSIAGGKLKEAGLTHWNSPNTGATNSSGFTALPGGYRLTSGTYNFIGKLGYWWTSTESTTSDAFRWKINYDTMSIGKTASLKQFGFSVRCIKN
jgi:uncharacterized protein (TIGR02145 family)